MSGSDTPLRHHWQRGQSLDCHIVWHMDHEIPVTMGARPSWVDPFMDGWLEDLPGVDCQRLPDEGGQQAGRRGPYKCSRVWFIPPQRLAAFEGTTATLDDWQALFAHVPGLAEEFPFFHRLATEPVNDRSAHPWAAIRREASHATKVARWGATLANAEYGLRAGVLGLITRNPLPTQTSIQSGAIAALNAGLHQELVEKRLQEALFRVYESLAKALGERLMVAYEAAHTHLEEVRDGDTP